MRITLTTNTGRLMFEKVDTIVMDDHEIILWNDKAPKRKTFKPAACTDMHIEFTNEVTTNEKVKRSR